MKVMAMLLGVCECEFVQTENVKPWATKSGWEKRQVVLCRRRSYISAQNEDHSRINFHHVTTKN